MKLTEFNAKRSEYQIEGTGVDTVTTALREWKHKDTKAVTFAIPAGTSVHVDFSPKKHSSNIFITIGDEVRISRIEFAFKWLRGFKKPPGLKALEKMSFDGIATTCLGSRVEPDGYGYKGDPSWLLVLGLM